MDQYETLLTVNAFYKYFLYANLVACSLLYAFVLYLIHQQTPKNMSILVQFNLLNMATNSYLYCVLMVVWQPIPLFSINGLCYGGFFHYSSTNLFLLMHKLQLFLIFNIVLIFMMSFLHQFSLFSPFSKLSHYFGRSKWFALIYLGCSLTTATNIWFFFDSIQVDKETFKNYLVEKTGWNTLSSDTSFLIVVIENEPSLTFFTTTNPNTKPFFTLMAIFLVVEAMVIVLINFKIVKEIQKTKSKVQTATHKLHIMFHKTFLLCSASIAVFFFVPSVFLFLSFWGIITSIFTALAFFALLTFHTSFLLSLIIWAIVPYRRYVYSLINKNILFKCVDVVNIKGSQ